VSTTMCASISRPHSLRRGAPARPMGPDHERRRMAQPRGDEGRRAAARSRRHDVLVRPRSAGRIRDRALLGYLVGAPTYSLMAELALSRAMKGCLRAVRQFPDALSRGGGRRWALPSASPMRGCVPSVAISPVLSAKRLKAVIETAHALACRRRVGVLNGRLVELTGPQDLHARFTGVPTSSPGSSPGGTDYARRSAGREVACSRLADRSPSTS